MTAVTNRSVSIRLACQALGISQTCYRYQPKLAEDNAEIADWLIRLTHNQRNWGFGLCFLYLRNVKGYCWNAAPPNSRRHFRCDGRALLAGQCPRSCSRSRSVGDPGSVRGTHVPDNRAGFVRCTWHQHEHVGSVCAGRPYEVYVSSGVPRNLWTPD